MMDTDDSQSFDHYVFEGMNGRGAWTDFLSWVRFCVYQGDLADLYEHVKELQDKAVFVAVEDGEDEKLAAEHIVVGPQDLETEVLAWNKIQLLAEEALAKFPTSYEEDLQLLESVESGQEELSFNKQNCLKLRIGEKKLLNFITRTAKSIIDLSTMTRKEAVKRMMMNHVVYKKNMDYVQKVFVKLLPSGDEVRHEDL
jgi:hypothetical protein